MVAVRAVSWRWRRREPRAEPDPGEGSLVALAALSLVAGAGTGLVVAIFRVALARAEDWRGALIARAHQQSLIGLVAVLLGCAASVALAAWLVRRFFALCLGKRHSPG
jgi:hypothetical protein